MGEEDCKHHVDHETRIKNLEIAESKRQDSRVNPGLWLGIFSFLGICFSTFGVIIARLIDVYFK